MINKNGQSRTHNPSSVLFSSIFVLYLTVLSAQPSYKTTCMYLRACLCANSYKCKHFWQSRTHNLSSDLRVHSEFSNAIVVLHLTTLSAQPSYNSALKLSTCFCANSYKDKHCCQTNRRPPYKCFSHIRYNRYRTRVHGILGIL